MMTKKSLIDDIILRVSKGAPSDDLELEPSQIAFWFDLVAGAILAGYLKSLKNKNESLPAVLIEIEDDKVGTVENVTMLDGYNDRVYISLAKTPIALVDDGGVLRVITEEGSVVNNIAIERLDTLNNLRFGKPTRDNLIYTRINNRLYIQGLSPKHIGITKFSVYYIPKPGIVDADDDDEIKLPDEVTDAISEAVEQKARKQLHGIADIENDAEDDTEQ